MTTASCLVIAEDPSIVELVAEAAGTVKNLRCEVAAGPDEGLEQLRRDGGCSVVVVHLRRDEDHDRVARLLGRLGGLGRPITALTISDRYEAHRALPLIRLGVAECLSRP